MTTSIAIFRSATWIVLVCFFVGGSAVWAQGSPSILDQMSEAQFTESGLEKLTSEELNRLDDWLLSYVSRIVEAVDAQHADLDETPAVIESRIDGTFEGWTGNTIFKLMNGQIWQQVQYDYHYTYSFMPSVLIVKTDAGYRMQVDRVSRTILVERLK